jgi:hypothetical protein
MSHNKEIKDHCWSNFLSVQFGRKFPAMILNILTICILLLGTISAAESKYLANKKKFLAYFPKMRVK